MKKSQYLFNLGHWLFVLNPFLIEKEHMLKIGNKNVAFDFKRISWYNSVIKFPDYKSFPDCKLADGA